MNLLRSEPHNSISRVLVPINGDPTDASAINLACEIANKRKAEIFALYVIEVKRALPLDAELPPEVQKAEDVLQQAEHLAEKASYHLETELLQSREVGPAIVDEACEKGVDLIIMGVPYKKRFGEYSLGRTVPYVLKNAPCEVWVCREPQTSE